MIKLVALTSIVISGSLFGTILCKAEKDTLKEAEELYGLISYVQAGIEKKSLPLNKIFSNYIAEKKSPYIEQKLKGFRGSYGEKILFLYADVCSEATQNELKDFAQTLGALDKSSQLESLKRIKNCLEKDLSNQRKETLSKIKLYKTLSLLISCIIAVLLY